MVPIRGKRPVNETIRLLGNRSYCGESRTGTVLKRADGANLVAIAASPVFLDDKSWTDRPVSVRHLQIDGNRKNNIRTATAGLVLRAWRTVVEEAHILTGNGWLIG